MIPQTHKIDFSKCQNKSKGYDTANATFKKYGKEWPIKEYVQAGKDNTSAKDIIQKAGGLQNLPQINQKLQDTGIVLDMNEDIFTINHKIKLGNIAKKKLDTIKAEMEKVKAEKPAKETATEE